VRPCGCRAGPGGIAPNLTPLFVVGADIVVGLFLHTTHPGWRWYVLAGASLAAPALLVAGQRLGLLSLRQRAYAAVVALSDGFWLSIAAGVGPLRAPLPQLLAAGGIILAVPWWCGCRRRCARVAHRAQARSLAGDRASSRPGRLARDVGRRGSRGWHAHFRLARGQTIADVMARLPAIESALGAVRGAARAYPTPDNLAHRFELRVLEIDPQAEAIPWPGPSAPSVIEPIDLGPFEDAAPARLLLLRRHALIGGTSGSGKSGAINVLMASLSVCSDVVIWAIDLKRGMELQPWASCIGRLATTPEQATAGCEAPSLGPGAGAAFAPSMTP
jgi:hypothetical protein